MSSCRQFNRRNEGTSSSTGGMMVHKYQLDQPRTWHVNLQDGSPARVTGLNAQALQLVTGIQQIWHIGLVESHVLNREASKTSECVGIGVKEPDEALSKSDIVLLVALHVM